MIKMFFLWLIYILGIIWSLPYYVIIWIAAKTMRNKTALFHVYDLVSYQQYQLKRIFKIPNK